MTSTPFVRRKPALKTKEVRHEIKVSVHDGVGTRSVTLSSSEGLLDVLNKIATVMQRLPRQVQMGYEAPWSSKSGSKKILAYITNEEELEDFWSAYNGYLEGLGPKKRKDLGGKVPGILFSNMLESAQVSGFILFFDAF